MPAVFNVAPSASRRALLFGLLLLAPQVSSLVIQGQSEPDQTPDDALEAGELATDVGAHEATNAVHGAATVISEVADTGRLIETEQKKLRSHLDSKAKALLPQSLAGDDGSTDYLISSFPELRVINYVRLPDLVWRPLVVSGLMNPKSIVVDEDRFRLYVADSGLAKIVWYQLIALPDKTLISDGRQHVAVQLVSARNLALDLTGNLWYSGSSTPLPPTSPIDAIWKQPLLAIDQSSLSGTPIEPISVWTSGHTKSSPSPLVLDAFNIYYGNDAHGKSKGSIVKAGQSVPMADPGSGLGSLADNVDTTYSVAVTPTAVFYGADGAVYGVRKSKIGGSCGATGDLCKTVTDMVKKPTSMLWNGDGTIFVADNGAGAIYSFASGSVSPHALDKVIDAGEVWGLDILKVVRNQDSSASSMAPALVLLLLSALMILR